MRSIDEMKSKDNQANKQFVDLTGQGAQRAEVVSDQPKGVLRQKAEQGRQKVAGKVSAQAESLRRTSERLRTEGATSQARIIDLANGQLTKLGSYLEKTELGQIVADIEEFAHTKPWKLAASAFGIGRVYGRIKK